MNLETTYMGLHLRTPLVVSASPLSGSLDNVRTMEDEGASAIVLFSLFEEQLRSEQYQHEWSTTQGTESYSESLSYFPNPHRLLMGPESYLDHIARVKKAVSIPVIASLNGATPGGWVNFAKEISISGADALELNLYYVPTDVHLDGIALEQQYLDVLKAVKKVVRIPMAVKVSPYFSNFANMARKLDENGANALVMFNRFYQPDIDLETLEIMPNVIYSTPMAMRLPMRWIALLHGRLNCSLAATSGIYTGTDALKMLMVGADVTMLCSALMIHGLTRIRNIEEEMLHWMQDHDYASVEQLKGSMSQRNCHDPAAFERAQYIRGIGAHIRG